MSVSVAQQLEESLDQFLLRRNRDTLCNPVIAVAPTGVDRQTYPLLTSLARLGTLSAARLAEEIGIDRSNASRYADRLERAGLLERGADPQDRRATLLALTPRGSRVARELHRVLTNHLQELISSWPPGQAEALIKGIRLLIEHPKHD
jgi:DNA-binding MarR family transcriptional regulator